MILDTIDNARLYIGLNTSFTAEHAETAETRSEAKSPLRKNNIINSAYSAASAVNPVVNPGFAKAFEILTDKTLSQKEDGKYTVDGEKIYYTIQHYTTKPMFNCRAGLAPPMVSPQVYPPGRACLGVSPNLEAHRKYIDIQFLLEGVEILGYAPLKGLTTAEVYNPQRDIAFFNTPKEITKVKLEPGLFCILFPDDAHLPCRQLAGPTEVRKVVIKIRL